MFTGIIIAYQIKQKQKNKMKNATINLEFISIITLSILFISTLIF